MVKNKTRELLLLSLASSVVLVQGCACFARAVPFADNGTLKMLYDNRMHPQALEHDGSVYIVWRGEKGFPYIISYDLESREFSKPSMLLAGMEEKVDAQKYKKDHHFSPVIWVDSEGYFHVLSGCHGNTPEKYTSGNHVISTRPGDITKWKMVTTPINSRYNVKLDRDSRYNLYYVKVDLASGKVFNYHGKELATPVRKMIADRDCLIWDTQERVVAIGASIYLDENEQPYFLLPVSDETPYKCRFYFLRRQNEQWKKTAITRISTRI